MGFLNHSTNNIVIDAVLTNEGRNAIAEGGLDITKFALSDDEVDYTIIKKYGRIVGKEKIEKNTPIFEASTAADLGLKYFLNNGDTEQVGQILQTFTLALSSGDGITAGNNIAYNQNSSSGNTTNTFQIRIDATGVLSETLTNVALIEDGYEFQFSSTFLSHDGSSSMPAQFGIKAAAKNLPAYHNANQKLVLPITIKNQNGFEQTIFITIDPFAA